MNRLRNEQGFSLVEIVVAVAVIVIGVLALLAALSASTAASASSEDTRLAMQALRRRVALIQAADFEDLWDAYNPINGHSRTFTTDGTTVASDGVTIAGLRDGSGTVELLTEREAEAALGTAVGSIDLDGDGVLGEGEEPAAGWRAYAVRVSVTFEERWRAATRTLDCVTIVVDPGT